MRYIHCLAEKCTGCRACELACVWAHTQRFALAESRIKVSRVDAGSGFAVRACHHCPSAVCIEVCALGARYKKNGFTVIDYEKCVGCGNCAASCPFQATWLLNEHGKALTCDLCSTATYKFAGSEYACVARCPRKALLAREYESREVSEVPLFPKLYPSRARRRAWYGYAGRALWVDLGKQKILKKELERAFAKQYLGGTGFCARVLFDCVPPAVAPFAPENYVLLATGPVTATLVPASGRYVFATKSPLTGIWAESHIGGFFAPELKYAGYDYIVLTGKAPKPVYLCIEDGSVSLRDARHLWGKDTHETTDTILEDIGDHAARVACIGIAGENLVRYACVISDKHRAAGRCGIGAVLGAKNLKAIVVRGTRDLAAADPERFAHAAEALWEKFCGGKWGEVCERTLGTVGTTGLVEAAQALGRLPTKNHYSGVFAQYEDIGSTAMKEKYRKARRSCFGCAVQCKYVACVEEGRYAGTTCEGPEYETIMAFGSNCMNNDLASIIRANLLCNLYGLDTISAGKVLSFAMECRERGLLDASEAPRWGDGDAMLAWLHRIANREGFGDKLAEGVRRLAGYIGKGAEALAIHVKGLEVSGQDGRAHKSIGLALAIGARGGDHLRAISSLDELGFEDVIRARFPEVAEALMDILSERAKGVLIADMEELYAVVDSLLVCKYGTMWPPVLYFDDFVRVLPPLTGIHEFGNVRYLRELARRICLLRRAFNARLGLRRAQDTLPSRMLREPMPEGPAKGETVKLNVMLDEYYAQRGCDADGMPKKDFFPSAFFTSQKTHTKKNVDRER